MFRRCASIIGAVFGFLIVLVCSYPSEDMFQFVAAHASKTPPPTPDGLPAPLPPDKSLDTFKVAEDLAWEQVLAEPTIAQPVFLNFDERGRMWVVEYRQYPEPAGLKMVSHDKYWRAVYDKTPKPPPFGVRGKDRISIHEDTDGDGTFDSHKVFLDGLNIATACCRGRGGVWVLNPPYLLFYPDRDGDDVPDGHPDVHLSGFGLQDTHSVVNSLRWGPDGWLYAAQGSTVTGSVVRPGIDKKPRNSLGQNIWRYHPETKAYEIFAEGGGNAFGVEIDSKGRIFSGHNGGNTRGFHYVQGGYLRKGFTKHGPLSNPYAYGYFDSMQHHSVPRFTHTFLTYDSEALPPRYRGKLFGVEPLQGQIVVSDFDAIGATFKTKDVFRPVTSDDRWFRPVDIKLGPDGAIYVADWYDARVAHYVTYQEQVDESRGRIYRMAASNHKPSPAVNLAAKSSLELVKFLKHSNRQIRQTALRLLGDRKDLAIVPKLKSILATESGQDALEALWALNLTRPLTDADAEEYLNHEDPFVRLWTARLICDDHEVAFSLAEQMAELAAREHNIEVRAQLACSARRLPAKHCFPIVEQLLVRSEDVADKYQPLLLWWAIEQHFDDGREHVLALMSKAGIWDEPMIQTHIAQRIMRRLSATGKRADLLDAALLLEKAPTANAEKLLLEGFELAYRGRSLAGIPVKLSTAITSAGGGTLPLRLRLKEPKAIQQALEMLEDEESKREQLIDVIEVLGEIKLPSVAAPLTALIAKHPDQEVIAGTLASLRQYNTPEVGQAVLASWARYESDTLTTALNTMVNREIWTIQLLAAIKKKRIVAESIPAEIVRRMTVHDADSIAEDITRIWGDIDGATTEQMKSAIRDYSKVLKTGSGDPYRGQDVFVERCGKCHVLFAQGGYIGPDLTPYQRTDLNNMLLQIVNPSAEIREGFETSVVITSDGRVITGFVNDKDQQVVTIRGTDARDIRVPRSKIDTMQRDKKSLMPEGLLKTLTDQQLRDLFAYLRSAQPLNVKRTTKPKS